MKLHATSTYTVSFPIKEPLRLAIESLASSTATKECLNAKLGSSHVILLRSHRSGLRGAGNAIVARFYYTPAVLR